MPKIGRKATGAKKTQVFSSKLWDNTFLMFQGTQFVYFLMVALGNKYSPQLEKLEKKNPKDIEINDEEKMKVINFKMNTNANQQRAYW